MANPVQTWEWHLTANGWIPGLRSSDRDAGNGSVGDPADRLASYVLEIPTAATPATPPPLSWTQTWTASDAGAINALMKRLGPLPLPVVEMILSSAAAANAPTRPRVRVARAS